MTRITAPNPDRRDLQPGVITAGTPAAAQVVAQARNGAAFKLGTWRIHQSHCESCAAYPDGGHGGPGCGDGFRLWYRWRNAQDHADALAAILAPEPPAPAPEAASDQLTLF